MAENTGNIGSKHGKQEHKFRLRVYKQLWSIPDWDNVQQSEDLFASQTFEFCTGESTAIQTKWLLGFNMLDEGTKCCMYWKLIAKKGFPEGDLDAVTMCSLINGGFNFTKIWTDVQSKPRQIGQIYEVPKHYMLNDNGLHSLCNPFGELTFKLKLVIKEPETPFLDKKMELFHATTVAQLGASFCSVLGDEATADVKIITSDGVELLAHKVILKAQSSVFDSMFRSDLSENKTGEVNVKDVTSKTMDILLHFFYTGELLPAWKDDDTVVEFAYAVGKYQLTSILKLLDEVLAHRDEKDATFTDVQLLDMVQKLGLETAEKELLERIKKTTSRVISGMDLFALYGIMPRREIKIPEWNCESQFENYTGE